MWLIDTSTFLLREFTRSAPPYATLSHVTEENEVPLEGPAHTRREIRDNSSYTVEKACSQARTAGIEWLWTYTTCVDRRSSAAQSEAINSLPRIYRGCEYTIIYLADIVLELVGDARLDERLAECRWMKNIWAIPQIIFSRGASFFSSNWTLLGTKVSLLPIISSTIGIDRPVLEDPDCLEDYSIARRMSWASDMTTPRPEDSAYALLGLFNVSMPIIHGEGPKAFFKLQEEILKNTSDFSLLAWDNLTTQEYTGLFAPSPACFHRFKNGPTTPLSVNGEVQIHCAGITMETTLWKLGTGLLLLPLQTEHGSFCSVPLIAWDGCFVRKGSQVSWNLPGPKSTETARVCVKRDLSAHVSKKISAYEGIASEKEFQSLGSLDVTDVTRGSRYSNVHYNSEQGTCNTAPATETNCQMAPQLASTVSSKVTPHQDMDLITDSEVDSCLSHQNGRTRQGLAEPYRGLVGKDDEETTVSGMSVAPTCPISSVLLSEPVSMVKGNGHYKTKSSPSPAAVSEFDRHARPSCVPEGALETYHVLEHCTLDDSETEVSSSLDQPVSRISKETLQSLASINRSRSAETQVLNVASITEELANNVADEFLSLRRGNPPKRSFVPWNTENRKRIKHTNSSNQLGGVSMSDCEDGEMVLVEKSRFFACPFYVRNSQYTKCLKGHRFDSIADIKDHICWDHRRPKFCPVCKEQFSSGTDRDAHIRLRTCNVSSSTEPDGITDYQEEQLEREDKSFMSEDTRWSQIWDIIFPHIARPKSAFYTSERDVSVSCFRKSWLEGGEKVVADFLESKKCREYNIRNEERNLRTIYDQVMENVVGRIFEEFGDMSREH